MTSALKQTTEHAKVENIFEFVDHVEHEHSDIELSGTNNYAMQHRQSIDEQQQETEADHLNVQKSYSTSSRDQDLKLETPMFQQLKSKLLTPKDIIIHNNTKYEYNPVADGATDRAETALMTPNSAKKTIRDKLENTQSGADVILYDPPSMEVDDEMSINNTLSRAEYDTLTLPKLPNKSIANESWNSDFDLDDLDEEEDDDERTNAMIESSNDENKVGSTYCLWLKKYFVSIVFTIILWMSNAFLHFYYYPNHQMHLFALYVQQIIFILSVVMTVLMLWKFISYSLFISTANHCCHGNKCERFIFYIHHSSGYISYSFVSTVAFVQWEYLISNPDERVDEILDNTEPETIDFITRTLLCFMILCLGLFVKTIFIRWIVLKFYLSNLVLKLKTYRKYESWLKMICGKAIFSIKVKRFLDINSLHQQNHSDFNLINLNQTVAFRLDALRDFNLMGMHSSSATAAAERMDVISEAADKVMSSDDESADDESADDLLHDSVNSKLVNTLTSGRMFGNLSSSKYSHNSQTCLLWLYNSKTKSITLIDDNELNKVCKQFAKCIVTSVIKHRFNDRSMRGKRYNTKPTFSELKTMFNKLQNANNGDNSGGEAQEKKPTPRHKLKRSSMTVGGDAITQKEFLQCFAKYNQTKQGYEAWKEINKSDAQCTKKELQRWLYQYLHGLIYLKQKLNSYHDILLNLDASTHSIAIFVLMFVFLVIFKYSLIDAVTIYFTFCALLAVFGKNIFVQFFDALYFVFVLQPFSIGDVVLIDNKRYTITKIHVMSTEMTTSVADGHTLIIKNNAKLLGKDIKNVSKTKAPYHNISFYVSQNTTFKQLNELKSKLDAFIRSKMKNDIREMWFILDGVDKECRMKISLFLGSLYSFSDSGLMWRQYHLINMEIARLVKKMNIQYKRFSSQDVQLSALIEEQQQHMI